MPETQEQYKARILSHIQGREPLSLLASAPDKLAALLANASPAILGLRPDANKWSIQEIVAHLVDDELVGATGFA
jgi:DinB superfamily